MLTIKTDGCFLTSVFASQVIFITEYMSSGSLKQFLKKTKKNHKTMNVKVGHIFEIVPSFSFYTFVFKQGLHHHPVVKKEPQFCECASHFLCVFCAVGMETLVHTDLVCPQVKHQASPITLTRRRWNISIKHLYRFKLFNSFINQKIK